MLLFWNKVKAKFPWEWVTLSANASFSSSQWGGTGYLTGIYLGRRERDQQCSPSESKAQEAWKRPGGAVELTREVWDSGCKVRGKSKHVSQISLSSVWPCVVLQCAHEWVKFSGLLSLLVLAPSLFATVRVFPQINYLRVTVDHKGKKKKKKLFIKKWKKKIKKI